MMDNTSSRHAAAVTVEAIAKKLADPESALNDVIFENHRIRRKDSLDQGYAGFSLLFAELAVDDSTQRDRAHNYLVQTMSCQQPSPQPSLYVGPAALGFAVHTARSCYGGYARILTELDEAITRHAKSDNQFYRDRIIAGGPIGELAGYDVLSGTTGLGRYLLARYEETGDPVTRDALTGILGTLVSIAVAGNVAVQGKQVSAWWVHESPKKIPGGPGHTNLGMAHGVCGPLALLALAWKKGVQVPRQDEAIEHIVALLMRWRIKDSTSPRWPFWLELEHMEKPGSGFQWNRDAWCYGAAGISRALHLAGDALNNRTWKELARSAFEGIFSEITGKRNDIIEFGLCHGLAGLLQVAFRMAVDTDEAVYREITEKLAGLIIGAYDPEKPYGYSRPMDPVHSSGFLIGAVGIALALHTYVVGRPYSEWDSALMLS
ncbi:lanthionine synthetase C family protein [Streptomyces albidoflavus]